MAIAVVLAALLSGCASGAAPTPQIIYVTPEPTEATYEFSFEPEPVVPVRTKPTIPSTFAKLTSRDWAKVVKTPDSYVGKGYWLWACILQFDAATGPDSFLGWAWYKKTSAWYNADNTSFFGDASKLADFVESDMVYMKVVGMGAFSYDTQVGGNTTVPSFWVHTIALKGSC